MKVDLPAPWAPLEDGHGVELVARTEGSSHGAQQEQLGGLAMVLVFRAAEVIDE